MNAAPDAARRGRIDEIPDLEKFDLVKFNDSINPYGNDFISGGFREGKDYFRTAIRKWKFEGLGKVADIGCGYGRWSLFLAEVNESVVGFERNEKCVSLCRKLAAHFHLPNASFETCDVTRLSAGDAVFDGAWCFNTMQFLDRERALKEIHRTLKPGGILYLGHYNGAARVLEKFFQGFKAGGLAHATTRFALRGLRGGPFYNGPGNYASAPHMREVLETFGFELLDDPPMEIETKSGKFIPARLTDLMGDLSALAERLEGDEDFATEFAAFPELAYGLTPVNVAVRAIKR